MPCLVVVPGDVVRLQLPAGNNQPSKYKFCLCVCVEDWLFFLINTDRARIAPFDSQVLIRQMDFPFLKYDSFIDVSKIKRIPPEVVFAGENCGKPLRHALIQLRSVIIEQPYLAERYLKKIRHNWPS